MAFHYHDPSDLNRLREMQEVAPTEFKAWMNLDSIVGRKDGAVPQKFRELIAVAVAHTTQCVYCIDIHTKHAKKAGATKAELVEAILIASALRAGAAAAHGAMALKLYDEG